MHVAFFWPKAIFTRRLRRVVYAIREDDAPLVRGSPGSSVVRLKGCRADGEAHGGTAPKIWRGDRRWLRSESGPCRGMASGRSLWVVWFTPLDRWKGAAAEPLRGPWLPGV